MPIAKELKDEIKGRECLNCGSVPRVAWLGGQDKLRCDCFPDEPMLVPIQSRRAERLGDMLQAKYPEAGAMVNVEERALATTQGPGLLSMPAPVTIEEYDREKAMVVHIIADMQNGKDYGLIPGTTKKSLWEPGAEALRRAFRIVWQYRVIAFLEDDKTGDYRYTIQAFQLLSPGIEGIMWEASASSKERKFWCSAKSCPPKDCPQTHPPAMERAMLRHNVKDRAIKRAFVALIRNITGTSGEFDPEQDVDGVAQTVGKVFCPEHKGVEMIFKEGKWGPYYSHKQGSKWCNKKAADVENAPSTAQPPATAHEEAESIAKEGEEDFSEDSVVEAMAPQEAWTKIYNICNTKAGMGQLCADWVRDHLSTTRSALWFSGNANMPNESAFSAKFPQSKLGELAEYLDSV